MESDDNARRRIAAEEAINLVQNLRINGTLPRATDDDSEEELLSIIAASILGAERRIHLRARATTILAIMQCYDAALHDNLYQADRDTFEAHIRKAIRE